MVPFYYSQYPSNYYMCTSVFLFDSSFFPILIWQRQHFLLPLLVFWAFLYSDSSIPVIVLLVTLTLQLAVLCATTTKRCTQVINNTKTCFLICQWGRLDERSWLSLPYVFLMMHSHTRPKPKGGYNGIFSPWSSFVSSISHILFFSCSLLQRTPLKNFLIVFLLL